MRKLIFFFTVILTVLSCNNRKPDKPLANSENIILTLNLKGKKYDSLRLRLFLSYPENSKTIKGKADKHGEIVFTVPAKDYEMSYIQRILEPDTDKEIVFFTVFNGDTLKGGSRLNFDSINHINGEFYDEGSYNYGYNNEYTSSWLNFKVPEQEGEKLLREGYTANHSDMGDLVYDGKIEELVHIIRENSGNKVLLQFFFENIIYFKTEDEARTVFDNFSDKLKQSYYGKRIEKYINKKFENIELISAESRNPEPVIVDTLRYNFIIFSASWCSPCIQSIPKYMKIYNDFKDKMDFTYISEDEPKDYDKWNDLMKKHNIPWRSLFSGEQTEKVNDMYYRRFIPFAIMVEPGGKFHTVLLFEEEDVENFYELMSNVLSEK